MINYFAEFTLTYSEAGRKTTIRVDIDQFARRLVHDAILDAMPAYWRGRAATFEWARLRPTDFIGRATTQVDLVDQDQRLAEAAEACRQHALVLEGRLFDGKP